MPRCPPFLSLLLLLLPTSFSLIDPPPLSPPTSSVPSSSTSPQHLLSDLASFDSHFTLNVPPQNLHPLMKSSGPSHPLFVTFTSPWCSHCKTLLQELLNVPAEVKKLVEFEASDSSYNGEWGAFFDPPSTTPSLLFPSSETRPSSLLSSYHYLTIDSTDEDSDALISKFKIQGYPSTIILSTEFFTTGETSSNTMSVMSQSFDAPDSRRASSIAKAIVDNYRPRVWGVGCQNTRAPASTGVVGMDGLRDMQVKPSYVEATEDCVIGLSIGDAGSIGDADKQPSFPRDEKLHVLSICSDSPNVPDFDLLATKLQPKNYRLVLVSPSLCKANGLATGSIRLLKKSHNLERTLSADGMDLAPPTGSDLSMLKVTGAVPYYEALLGLLNSRSYVIYKQEDVTEIFNTGGIVVVHSLIFLNFDPPDGVGENDNEELVIDDYQRKTLEMVASVDTQLNSQTLEDAKVGKNRDRPQMLFVLVPKKEESVFKYFGVAHVNDGEGDYEDSEDECGGKGCVANMVIINALIDNGSQGLRTFYHTNPKSGSGGDAEEFLAADQVGPTLSTMVADFHSNKLKSFVRSEEVTQEDYQYNSEGLQKIKGNSFPAVVFGEDAHDSSIVVDPKFSSDFSDSLIVFYAPWCGHSSRVLKILEELQQELNDSSTGLGGKFSNGVQGILLGMIDATVNEVEFEGAGGMDDDNDDAQYLAVGQLPSIYYFSKAFDPSNAVQNAGMNKEANWMLPYDRAVEFDAVGMRMDVEGFKGWIMSVRAEGTERGKALKKRKGASKGVYNEL